MKSRKKILVTLLALLCSLTMSVAFSACEGVSGSLGSIFGSESSGGETEEGGNGETENEEEGGEEGGENGGETPDPEPEPTPDPGHTCVWGEWSVTEEATCVAEGQKQRVCTLDSTHVQTESIPVDEDNHTIVRYGEDATHTMMGYWYEYCENGCDYYISGDDTPVIHDGYLQWVDGQDPTCTEDGWCGYYECTYDGCDYSTYYKISATGHSEVTHKAKTATCVEDGWNTYVTCRNCDYSTYEENKIPAFVHDFTNGTCSKCQMPKPTEGLTMTLQSDDTYKVSGASSCWSEGRIVIPDYYNGKPVTAIGDRVFYNNTNITNVIITDYVKTIGDSAFYGCSKLLQIEFGKSVQTIDYSAFNGCTRLVKVRNKSSIEVENYISNEKVVYTESSDATIHMDVNKYIIFTYEGLVSLIGYDGVNTSLTLPDGITEINAYAFQGCSSLTSVSIPDSVTTIGSYAFSGCSSLTDIYYQGTLEDWCGVDRHESNLISGGDNFYIDNQLVSGEITIPDTVTEIKPYAFQNCSALTKVTIPDSVTTIGDFAFDGCTSLASLKLGNGLTTIGSSAFKNCDGLYRVTIPDLVTTIGDSAFYDCDNLTYVQIYALLTSIGSNVFGGCDNLRYNEYDNAKYLGNDEYNKYLILMKAKDTSITSCYIPISTTIIYHNAFKDCTSLQSVTIPASVTYVGSSAFYGCTALTTATIGENVDTISWYAFRGCTSLSNITIPDSVTAIGSYAFSNCTSLASLTLGNGLTTICSYAFSSCTALSNVVIPDSVEVIDYGTFRYCTGLLTVTIGSSVNLIRGSAFDGCTNLVKATFKNTQGWKVFSNETVSSSISSSNLADEAWAAGYLKSALSSWYSIRRS